jgi:hypothetical protein
MAAVCNPQRTRRDFVAGALGVAAVGLAGCGTPGLVADAKLPPADALMRQTSAIQVAEGLRIHPRNDWGADLPPKGAMGAEDVRFLLVHHTASANNAPDPRAVVRQTYAYQTGPAKLWPDICYHFMIGADGSIWEARAGSLAGPVIADATGGNQGFAQLVCLIGNFVGEAPTAAAQESLMRLLIFLADRYEINTDPNATVSFISRGSNRYRAGAPITTSTISGHRDCSATACPGDVGYSLLPTWRSRVNATRLVRDETGPYRSASRLGVHLT